MSIDITAAPTVTGPLALAPCSHRGRVIEMIWTLGPVTDSTEDAGTRAVQLFISHDTHRKEFSALIYPVVLLADGGLQINISLMVRGWRFTAPVARFSDKALGTFADTALAALRAAYTAGDPLVTVPFAPAL